MLKIKITLQLEKDNHFNVPRHEQTKSIKAFFSRSFFIFFPSFQKKTHSKFFLQRDELSNDDAIIAMPLNEQKLL
jgi:hypothetical protein